MTQTWWKWWAPWSMRYQLSGPAPATPQAGTPSFSGCRCHTCRAVSPITSSGKKPFLLPKRWNKFCLFCIRVHISYSKKNRFITDIFALFLIDFWKREFVWKAIMHYFCDIIQSKVLSLFVSLLWIFSVDLPVLQADKLLPFSRPPYLQANRYLLIGMCLALTISLGERFKGEQ